MRSFLALSALVLATQAPLFAQTCTGLCQQQVTCPAGQTTSITGTVYAPNGTDPLPNVLVYVPNAAVDPFTPGVSCPAPGTPPSGAPLVGTMTGDDGTFTITNMPVGTSIPLVIVSGRWRRQITVPVTTSCTNTPLDKTLVRMPRNQTEGDIPKIAIATGSVDQVECVLRKVGIDDAEFTNPSGSGRIHLYQGDGNRGSGGAIIDTSTPTESTLMGTASTLNNYDVLMLPCEGGQYTRSSTQLSNLVSFANAGGRVYSSHFSYAWMWQNPPFNTVANWTGSTNPAATQGQATVVTSFAEGQTLSNWLQLVGASTTPGQIAVQVVKRDISGVNSPTQPWLTLNANGNPIMQFVFDTPVGQTTGQCGRVLFNEYHVENPPSGSANNRVFPSECPNVAMTPQEKLLEFSLFELTDDGGQGTLDPMTKDFGTEPVGFSTAPQTFTWKNNSTFAQSVTINGTTGDFSVTSNNCASVAAYGSCQINVVFTPSAVGARTGTLAVSSGSQTLTAQLTGTGVPALTVSPTSLDFGSIDVGATVTKSVTITNNAPAALPFPGVTVTGDWSAVSNCGASVASNTSCTVNLTFKPTASGPRTGTMTLSSSAAAYANLSVALTGNGLDFSIAISPSSGTVIAGYSITTKATLTPLAGFAGVVTVSCTTNAPGSACDMGNASFSAASPVSATVNISTTSTYTVIGYSGLGQGGLLLLAIGSAGMLCLKRRSAGALARSSIVMLALLLTGFALTGCGGKAPGQNANPTTPGNYTYTVTATDGTITHTATYSLTVTAK